MKTLIVTLSTVFSLLSCQSAVWTFHAFVDNFTAIDLASPPFIRSEPQWLFQWDLAWDKLFPTLEDSGIAYDDGSIIGQYSGYADTLSISVDDGWELMNIWCGGPAPDYSGGSGNVYWENGGGGELSPWLPGEYWIDLDPNGLLRFSSSQPSDFGKWAWDGSINPNYVAPLAPKKHHGKK